MDAHALLDAYGGSIFPEEYRGKLEVADAEELLQRNGDSADDETLSRLLVLAVGRMLQGRLAEARGILDKLADRSTWWTFRRAIYLSYLEYIRRFPPIITFRPEHGGPSAMFRNLELDYRNTFERLGVMDLRQVQATSPADYTEFHLVQTLLSFPFCLWTESYRQHPEYPRGGSSEDVSILSEGLHRKIAHFGILRDLMDKSGFPQFGDHVQLIIITLYAGTGCDTDNASLATLSARYESRGDEHGQAFALMLQADSILSPPFTNPTALNMLPIDSTDAGSTNPVWDRFEGSMTLRVSEEAAELYRRAADLVHVAVSPRLHAAILLREACVLHLHGMGQERQEEAMMIQLRAAMSKLEEARGLCAGDEALEQMISCHRILVNLSLGRHENMGQEALMIGCWGKTRENEGLSQFLGLLMLRYGRWQWVRWQRIDLARRAFTCAVKCFEGLEDHILRFQALTFELDLFQSVSDFASGRALLDDQLPLFRGAILDMEKRAEQYPAMADGALLIRKNFLTTFGTIACNILRHSDVTKLRAFRDELDRYNAHRGTVDAANNALANPLVATSLLSGTRYEQEPSALFQDVDDDEAVFDRFHTAQDLYQTSLGMMDHAAAEEALHAFIESARLGPGSTYARYLAMIYAYFQLGETEEARQLFSRISDEEIFDGKTEGVPSSAFAWTKLHYQVRLAAPDGADNAIAVCTLTHAWERGVNLLSRIEALSPGYLDPSGPDLVPELWQRFCWAGLINEHNHRWKEAFHLYTVASDLLEVRRSNSSDVDTRRSMFSTLAVGDTLVGLARVCLHCHQAGIPLAVLGSPRYSGGEVIGWTDQALMFLEQATARSISDDLLGRAHAVDDDDYDDDEKGLILEKLAKRQLKKALAAVPENLRTAEEAAELDGISSEQTEADRFLSDLIPDTKAMIAPERLYRAIPEGTYVAMTRFTRHGSVCMGIGRDGIAYAQVSDMRDVDVRRPAFRALRHLHSYATDRGLVPAADDSETWDALSGVLLSSLSAMPAGTDHVLFAVSSPLSNFPFAALPYRARPEEAARPLLLSAAVSTIPSLTVLAHTASVPASAPAQVLQTGGAAVSSSPTSTRPARPLSVSVISKSMTRADLSDYARSVSQGGGVPSEAMLPMAAIEGMVIARLFRPHDSHSGKISGKPSSAKRGWPLRAKFVGREKFRAVLRQSDVLFLGTHGGFDRRSALLSYVSLQQRLRVADLAARYLRTSSVSSSSSSSSPSSANGTASPSQTLLVVFAACLSSMAASVGAVGGDALGFAHALLAAGVRSYLGALWMVDDTAAALLLVLFFRAVAAAAGGSTVAALWREAQLAFYQLDAPAARRVLDDMADGIARAEEDEGRDPSRMVHDYRFILAARRDGLDLDFKNPFYWAAFGLVGHATLPS